MAGLSFTFAGPVLPPDYDFLAMALPCAAATDGSVPADPCAEPAPTEVAYGAVYPAFASDVVAGPSGARAIEPTGAPLVPGTGTTGTACCVVVTDTVQTETPAAVTLPAAWPMAMLALAALAAVSRKTKQRR